MDSASYLAHLRRESGAFEACLAGDLSAPVEHCGEWTLYDLADHLGQGNMWAAMAVAEKRGDYEGPAAPRGQAALTRWFRGTCGVQLAALDTDPSVSAWTIAPPPTAGFWQRRRCLETLVHRWDAEHALGIPSQLDPELATDGVAEVVGTMMPRQVRLGRMTALPACDPPPRGRHRLDLDLRPWRGRGHHQCQRRQPAAPAVGPASRR